ncbi:MAG: type I restriction endonuclease subunit R [Candidatus Omnitrophota bacterium]
MEQIKADFDEIRQSQLPFVEVLINMGYTYLPAAEVTRQRGEDTSKFILKEIAAQALMDINEYEHHGKQYKFTEKNVCDAIDELENLPLEGLIDTSKTVYNMIMPTLGGKTIKVFHEGKNRSKSFRFIDFYHPEKNTYHVTVEYPASGRSNIRPDIVCFINGIPFVVIENKKASVEIGEAISQMSRNQRAEYCPKFFAYPQLLIAANGTELRYGTTMTPDKFYSVWKEKGVSSEDVGKHTDSYVNKVIGRDIYSQVCEDLKIGDNYKQTIDRLVTEQDKGIVCLLDPARLLDIAKNYIIYDAGIKKVMRYQQYFAVNKTLKRIEEYQKGVDGDKRRGGLLWHTQGSGKSLAMVMFVKALIEDPRIVNPRVIIVTDRKNLDKQIAETFKNCGLKKGVIRATSGQHLVDLLEEKNLNVITTLVHKFDTASNKRAYNLDKNIFVLIDEAHRTQSGIANLEMNRIMPNACYIGFTGTPLLKKERESWKKFGGYIDKYTIDDALKDNIILPLIYEGRYVDLIENREQIDRRVEALTKDLDNKAKKELQKLIGTKIIKDNPQRIADIAVDIELHYCDQFQNTGLKAQIVAPSKFSAVLMQKAFEYSGTINTALIISGENGIVDDEDAHKKEVIEYLEKSKERYRSLESYEKDVIESFKYNRDGIEVLIVVDKLLTGFDAPCNTVLYLAKDLRDHNLLQAIARVNRLFENRELPKTAGYIIDYSENAKNIDTAMKLFGNYDEEDVKRTLIDVKEKINELEQSYAEVHDLFKEIENKSDSEEYLENLGGVSSEDGEQKRQVFYEALNKFLRNFNECLVLQDFCKEFKHIDVYKKEIKKLIEIRKSASLRYADKVDLTKYKRSLVSILDIYVDAQGVELLTKQINITDSEQFEKAIETLGSDKSKAEAIAAQTERTITEKMDTDPEFYHRFSEKIHEILEKMRQEKMADVAALNELKEIKDNVVEKKDERLPARIKAKTGADIFYRNLQSSFGAYNLNNEEFEQIIFDVHDVLQKESIVDWYKNDEVKRIMRNKIDDYLYDVVKGERGIELTDEEMREILDKTMMLAENNHEIF